ncbi:MAG: DUF2017 family protein [Dermatophilaceae bacterium]
MAHGFRRKGDTFVARMDPAEVAVVTSLMDQTRSLLQPQVGATGDVLDDLIASLEYQAQPGHEPTPPQERDPALRRLLPDAHRGDPEVSAEFRRLTEQGLRQRKHAMLTAAIDALAAADADTEKVTLTRAQAQAVLVALTDTRLLLGERLGLQTEQDTERLALAAARAGPEDPLAYAVSVYDFLTWLQDSLTGAVMGRGLFH